MCRIDIIQVRDEMGLGDAQNEHSVSQDIIWPNLSVLFLGEKEETSLCKRNTPFSKF